MSKGSLGRIRAEVVKKTAPKVAQAEPAQPPAPKAASYRFQVIRDADNKIKEIVAVAIPGETNA
jgi:hypothetical protein